MGRKGLYRGLRTNGRENGGFTVPSLGLRSL